jgi:hypothetical protein
LGRCRRFRLPAADVGAESQVVDARRTPKVKRQSPLAEHLPGCLFDDRSQHGPELFQHALVVGPTRLLIDLVARTRLFGARQDSVHPNEDAILPPDHPHRLRLDAQLQPEEVRGDVPQPPF